MMKAIARLPNPNMGRCAFYMNRTVFAGLMRTALEKSTSVLNIESAASQFGKPGAMLSFMGIPIRQCDAITNTEEVLS
jgi:hypothetical protein